MGVDVAPPGRDLLELLAQLAHEHVHRPVAADHRVAPHALVDVLALEHAAVGGRELAQQLELLARQRRALLAGVGVVAVGTDRELAGLDRRLLERQLAGAPPTEHGLDPRQQLLGVARLGHPVVRAGAQALDPLGHRDRPAAHEQREAGQRGCDALDVVEAGERGIDDQRVKPERREMAGVRWERQHLRFPSEGAEPPFENGQQAAVIIDQRNPDRRRIAERCHRWFESRELLPTSPQ